MRNSDRTMIGREGEIGLYDIEPPSMSQDQWRKMEWFFTAAAGKVRHCPASRVKWRESRGTNRALASVGMGEDSPNSSRGATAVMQVRCPSNFGVCADAKTDGHFQPKGSPVRLLAQLK
jgi:hypothetical protein